jgi:twitching motility two-component system response regulator PilG
MPLRVRRLQRKVAASVPKTPDSVAHADSGKLYALVNGLTPWQTALLPIVAHNLLNWSTRLVERTTMVPEQNPLSGVKVMVIDDSNTIRRSAEIFLLQAGCTVILAEDGFDALAKITDHQPDLVFVDIMMPRLDGYQTCALIKKNAKFQGTPVIMLSSKDGLFDRARGRMVGSDQYLTKPFTKDSLLKTVMTHVSRTAGPVASAAR